jgi:hypothetical protein
MVKITASYSAMKGRKKRLTLAFGAIVGSLIEVQVGALGAFPLELTLFRRP